MPDDEFRHSLRKILVLSLGSVIDTRGPVIRCAREILESEDRWIQAYRTNPVLYALISKQVSMIVELVDAYIRKILEESGGVQTHHVQR